MARLRPALAGGLSLALLALAVPAAEAKGGSTDFGDAPDGKPTGYSTGVGGSFPSLAASRGPRHTTLGGLVLGAREDGEADSMQVDGDLFDDGVSVALKGCSASSRLTAIVNGAGLPAAKRTAASTIYVNAWFDWNRDGDWADGSDGCAPEWAIQNLPITADKLGAAGIAAIPIDFKSGAQVKEVWMRVTLTVDEPGVDPTGAGGATPYTFGETEDHFVDSRGDGGPTFKIRRKKKKKKKKGPKKKKGKFKVSCVPNPAFVFHGKSVTIKFKITDKGKGEIFGAFGGPRKGPGFEAKPNPVKPQPKGYPRNGRYVVKTWTFKSMKVDPPTRLEVVAVKFVFTRGKQVQKLTCTVVVIHLGPLQVPPFNFPRIGCAGPCAGDAQPFPPLDANLRSSYARRMEVPPGSTVPIEIVSLSLTSVNPITVGFDTVRFPLGGLPPPWNVGLYRYTGPGTATGGLAAPQGGPPSLFVSLVPPSQPGQQLGSFFDLVYYVPLPQGAEVPGASANGTTDLGGFVSRQAQAPPPLTGTGQFSAPMPPTLNFSVQFDQETNGFQIVVPGPNRGITNVTNVQPPTLNCFVDTQEPTNPNDRLNCAGSLPANTPATGRFDTQPQPPSPNMGGQLFGFQGPVRSGPFPITGPP